MLSNKLTIILPTEAKLEESERIGLLSRWKFYFTGYSKHFDLEIYSCDRRNFSKEIEAKHRSLPFSLNIIPYGNQILYNFYLLIRAPFMSKILRIISVSYIGLPLITAFKKKIVLSYQYNYETTTKRDFAGIKGFTSGIREYLSMKSANIVIVTTEELQEKVKEVYRRDSIIIPNFVDTSKFFPSEKEKCILYAGRVYWHKGIDYLIEAFAEVEKKYPEVELKLAGGGDIKYYKEKAKQLNLRNIQFLGSTDYTEMPEFMGKAKIFILPTVNREGNPKSLIEAMASGCACIATDVPGNRELIQDGENGLLVTPKNSESITEAIMKILNDESLGTKLSENARKTAQKSSLENTLFKEITLVKKIFEAKNV